MQCFFALDTVTDVMRQFKSITKLNDNGTWLEIDESKTVKKPAGMSGFSMNYSSFKGKGIGFNKMIAIGKNREDGSVGVIKIEFNSEEYKNRFQNILQVVDTKRQAKVSLQVFLAENNMRDGRSYENKKDCYNANNCCNDDMLFVWMFF